MAFDRDLTHQRYLVLLASKPVGKASHGRVWLNKRGEAFMIDTEGRILSVDTMIMWLKGADLLRLGPERARGGNYLVPTKTGLDKLDERLRGAGS
jgi:hypothetical protein